MTEIQWVALAIFGGLMLIASGLGSIASAIEKTIPKPDPNAATKDKSYLRRRQRLVCATSFDELQTALSRKMNEALWRVVNIYTLQEHGETKYIAVIEGDFV